MVYNILNNIVVRGGLLGAFQIPDNYLAILDVG